MAKKILTKSLKKIKEAVGFSVYSKEGSSPTSTKLKTSANPESELPNALQLIKEDQASVRKEEETSLTVEKEIIASVRNNPDPHGIAFRAWEIWKEQGCPLGQDLEHWLAAEAEQMRN